MMEYLRVTASQWRDIRAVFQKRGLEVYVSQEPDGIHVYGSSDVIQEVEHIIWAAQVVDGLTTVLGSTNFLEREGAFCRIEG